MRQLSDAICSAADPEPFRSWVRIQGGTCPNYAEVTSVAGIVPFQESSHLSLLKMTMRLSTNSLL